MIKTKSMWLSVFCLIVSGCGNRGDLYVPQDDNHQQKQEQTEQKNG